MTNNNLHEFVQYSGIFKISKQSQLIARNKLRLLHRHVVSKHTRKNLDHRASIQMRTMRPIYFEKENFRAKLCCVCHWFRYVSSKLPSDNLKLASVFSRPQILKTVSENQRERERASWSQFQSEASQAWPRNSANEHKSLGKNAV